jgi:hypothetical protein
MHKPSPPSIIVIALDPVMRTAAGLLHSTAGQGTASRTHELLGALHGRGQGAPVGIIPGPLEHTSQQFVEQDSTGTACSGIVFPAANK